jgi:hypothetical protein
MRVASEQSARQLKERMREQAFLGWQIYLMQPSGKMHRKMSLKKWLEGFDLLEEIKGYENVEELKKKALKTAENIIKMDKGRKRK